MHNNKKKLFFSPLLIMGSLFAASLTAKEVSCQHDEVNYQQCDNQLGWYIGGELGYGETDIGESDLDRFYNQTGINADAVSIDDSDTTSSLFLGYQFNTYFALEAGYLSLGERSVNFTGSSTDQELFFDSAEHVYPQSGDGLSINAVIAWPLTESFKIAVKLGYFDWEGDYTTDEANVKAGADTISDNDIWFGAELDYRLSEDIQVYASVARFELDRDTSNIFALGIRYFFNTEKVASATKLLIPDKTVKQPEPAKVVAIDSDKDGVLDSDDNCPESETAYEVDSVGCTVMAEQFTEFSLVIHFANDSAEIGPKYADKVREMVKFIKKYDVKAVTVYGHTSAPGTKAYNQRLSQQRASAIADILATQYGLDKSLIEPVGMGETQLLEPGDSEQSNQANRRIELTIKEMRVRPITR